METQQEELFEPGNYVEEPVEETTNVIGEVIDPDELSTHDQLVKAHETTTAMNDLRAEVSRLQGVIETMNQQAPPPPVEPEPEVPEGTQLVNAIQNYAGEDTEGLAEQPVDLQTLVTFLTAMNQDFKDELGKLAGENSDFFAPAINGQLNKLGEQQMQTNEKAQAIENYFKQRMSNRARELNVSEQGLRDQYRPMLDQFIAEGRHGLDLHVEEIINDFQSKLEMVEAVVKSNGTTRAANNRSSNAQRRQGQQFIKPKKVGESVSMTEDEAKAAARQIYANANKVVG